MKNWIRFFLGSPQRFLWTIAGTGVIAAVLDPSLPARAVNAVLVAVVPIIGPLVAIALGIAAIRFIIFGKK